MLAKFRNTLTANTFSILAKYIRLRMIMTANMLQVHFTIYLTVSSNERKRYTRTHITLVALNSSTLLLWNWYALGRVHDTNAPAHSSTTQNSCTTMHRKISLHHWRCHWSDFGMVLRYRPIPSPSRMPHLVMAFQCYGHFEGFTNHKSSNR